MGEQLRKRRLDLELRQEDVARRLGTNVNTVTNWELDRTEPALRYVPAIIEFLGGSLIEARWDGLPLPNRLRTYRRLHGLSQKRLAGFLGVDPTTVWHWEHMRTQPTKEHAERVRALLEAPTLESS